MMCSERELELSDEHDGIIDLPDDAPVGTSFAAYAHLDDPVIEINLTPNRPDATSIHGIARDLAAAGLGRLKTPAVEPVAGQGRLPGEGDDRSAATLCPGFALRLVRGVKNGPSPKWLQQRLIAIGLRPINALVDITNYITFDRGRPLHVFDAKKVAGNLVVRRAKDGEKVLALDGREYDADAGDVRHRRRQRRGVDRRHHGRRAFRLRRDDHRRADRIRRCGSRSTSPAPAARSASSPMRATASSAASIRNSWCRASSWRPRWCSISAAATPSETEVVGYAGHEPKIVVLPDVRR